MMPTATCQYCGWNGPADQCGPLKNACERVEPGTPMTAGACPECSASAMLDEATLARPEAINIHLDVEHRDGRPETIAIPADVAFIGEEGTWVEDAQPLVTRDSDLQPTGLCQLLQAAYFSVSDDPDADSHDTQRRRFREDATHMAIKLLASEDEARKHTIAEAVWREIFWVMPRDRDVSIKVSGGKVAVELGPETPAPQGVAA